MKDVSLKAMLRHSSTRHPGQKWGNRKHDNLWCAVGEHGLAARGGAASRPACCCSVVTSAVANFQMRIS